MRLGSRAAQRLAAEPSRSSRGSAGGRAGLMEGTGRAAGPAPQGAHQSVILRIFWPICSPQ